MKKTFINFLNSFNNKFIIFLITFCIIATISYFLYNPVLNYGISGIDDDTFINMTFEKYNIKNIFTNSIFNNPTISYFRPTLTISFFIDNFINQAEQTLHCSNLLFHIISSFLFFILLKKYFFNYTFSILATTLFVVHPANIFTVAWIPGRNDSLLFIFLLLSIIFFIEYCLKENKFLLFIHFIFFILALLTKESAIIIPFISIFYLLNNKNNFGYKKLKFITIIYLIFLLLYSLIHIKISSNSFPISHYLSNLFCYNLKTLLDYFAGIFFFNIHFSGHTNIQTILLGSLSIFVYIIILYFSKLNKKEKFFFFICPIIILCINLLAGELFYQASRIYIPLAFIIFVITHFFQQLKNKKIVYIIFLFLIIYGTIITSTKITNFKNELTFLNAIDSEMPNYSVYIANLYSYNLIKYGYLEQAKIKATAIAQKTNFKNNFNLYILSIIEMHEGNYFTAIEYLKQINNFDKQDVFTKLCVCFIKTNNENAFKKYYNNLINIIGNQTDTEYLIDTELKLYEKNCK